jgi:Raf kinase inhibitor-like YbhB/YbcL family protein
MNNTMFRRFWKVACICLAVALLGACTSAPGSANGFSIRSSAFGQGDHVPVLYTADGAGVSPPLSWDAPPAGTQSFALIMDDPDAPAPGGFTHWVLFNIPTKQQSLPENILPSQEQLPNGGVQGNNGSGKLGYRGPAPPPGSGIHLYRFNVYALNTMLDLKPGASKDDLVAAMGGHIIGNALIAGTYSRPATPTPGK